MAQDGVTADANTYMHTAALHLMGREIDLAFKALSQCKEAGLTPNGKMYVSLINASVRRRDLEGAQQLIEDMEADGHRVSPGLRDKAAGNFRPRDRE